MKKLLFFTAIVAVLLTSCKKEDEEDSDRPNVKSSSLNYIPMAIGNEWLMSQALSDYTQKVIGLKNIDGEVYFEMEGNINGVTSLSHTRMDEAGDYTTSGTFQYQNADGSVSPQVVKQKICDEYGQVGDTWTEIIRSNPYTTNYYVYTIKSVGSTQEAGGEVFTNVMQIDQELYTDYDFGTFRIQNVGKYQEPQLISLGGIVTQIGGKPSPNGAKVSASVPGSYMGTQSIYYSRGVGFILQTSTSSLVGTAVGAEIKGYWLN